jgi:hypothetical protein
MAKAPVYEFEVTSIEGLVQQLQIHFKNGYYFYVLGMIPEGKEPSGTDEKLIRGYRTDVSKWARSRRKRRGEFNVQYIRLGRLFVLLATPGTPPAESRDFFREETRAVKDARETPIKVGGYAVSAADGGRCTIGIEHQTYKAIKAEFVGLAPHRSPEYLAAKLWDLPFEPYRRVRKQLFAILKAVNEARKRHRREPVPTSAVRWRRRVCRPFEKGPAREAA